MQITIPVQTGRNRRRHFILTASSCVMERSANLDSLNVILGAEDRRFAGRVAGHASLTRIQIPEGRNFVFGETVMTIREPAKKLFILCSRGGFLIGWDHS